MLGSEVRVLGMKRQSFSVGLSLKEEDLDAESFNTWRVRGT